MCSSKARASAITPYICSSFLFGTNGFSYDPASLNQPSRQISNYKTRGSPKGTLFAIKPCKRPLGTRRISRIHIQTKLRHSLLRRLRLELTVTCQLRQRSSDNRLSTHFKVPPQMLAVIAP